MLALAGFLAESTAVPGYSGLVVDDPVCSLDHARVELVAKRLVREGGSGRQVIVFTHDLVFFYALREAAAKARVPWVSHWVRARADGATGVVQSNEEPWQAMKVASRVTALRAKLAVIRAIPDRTGEAYRDAVTDFYAGLRESWERLVEELLFNETVTRFQVGVKTQSLKGAMVEDEDYSRVFFAVAKASTYSGHDRPLGRQANLPASDELISDLRELDEYRASLAARRVPIEARRRGLESPLRGRLA
jgi:hypothetical protein